MKYLESYSQFIKNPKNISTDDTEQTSIVDELPNHVEESLSDNNDDKKDDKKAEKARREKEEQESIEKGAIEVVNPTVIPKKDSAGEPQQLSDARATPAT